MSDPTKIDLDELERKATRLATAAKALTSFPRGESPCDAVSELGFARHEYYFATPARVTLAMITRIRELEEAYWNLISTSATPAERALLAKGTVLP
jgi:hypothetical protein